MFQKILIKIMKEVIEKTFSLIDTSFEKYFDSDSFSLEFMSSSYEFKLSFLFLQFQLNSVQVMFLRKKLLLIVSVKFSLF